MLRQLRACLIPLFAFVLGSVGSQECETVVFTVFSELSSFKWESGMDLSSTDFNASKNFSLTIHGWNDGRTWIQPLTQQLLKVRGGFVIEVDYRSCIDDNKYVETLKNWKSVSRAVTSKLQEMETLGVESARTFIYGFSLGGRIAIDSAINFGKGKIGSIDVCDMANVGFDHVYHEDPKDAAENVQCIFTSIYAGSSFRDRCHQNWLMGDCGRSQPVANDAAYLLCIVVDCKGPNRDPPGSHPYCNNFYLSSFDNDFVANNVHNCEQAKIPEDLPADFKMGFMENRKHFRGVFAAPTFKNYPYNGSD